MIKNGRITSGGHAETGVEPARDFLERIGAPGRYVEKILPLIDRHMRHTPGGDVEISDSAVRGLMRRLDHANGGPTLQTRRGWSKPTRPAGVRGRAGAGITCRTGWP